MELKLLLALAIVFVRTYADPAALGGRIKHVVVLFEENRSFDHMLGWAKNLLKINGLSGSESNPVNVALPDGPSVKVTDGAPYIATIDPNHGFPAYNYKVFGGDNASQTVAKMNGYYSYEYNVKRHGPNSSFVMQGFAPEQLPVTVTLAQEFAIFDAWYTAFPGPSWPNHLFSITGTSGGCTETGEHYLCQDGALYPMRTIFESVRDAGLDWNMIYNDSRSELYIEYMSSDEAAQHTHTMDQFFHAARTGTLPALTWISPREGVNTTLGDLGGPNSDHPSCCDVALGERLRKDIYEAVRAGPGWNDTLFVFTWDDPGGLYDHVPTPLSAPAPDDTPSCPDKGFSFNRLGSRVPVVAVSPWLRRGTVVGEPVFGEDAPFEDSRYDSTSLIATLKELLGLPSFLTKRDAWSARFTRFLGQLEEPRGDCPAHLPDAPAPGRWGDLPANEDDDDDDDNDDHCDQPSRRQRRSILLTERQTGELAPDALHRCAHAQPHWMFRCPDASKAQASDWLAGHTERWRRRALRRLRDL